MPDRFPVCFAKQKLLPAKTRAFVDFVVDHFKNERLTERFSAAPTPSNARRATTTLPK